MTNEELELYKTPILQELFKRKMGALQDGDMVLWDDSVESLCTECSDRDAYIKVFMDEIKANTVIRIPDVVSRNSSRPERGLIGMIEHFYKLFMMGHSKYYCVIDPPYARIKSFRGPTITEACLKTLLYQAGQEEK